MPNKITSFNNCKNCPYNNGGTNLPIGLEYTPGNKELLVFQAPGIDEWNGNTCSDNRIPIDSVSIYSAANRMRKSFERKNVSRSQYDIVESVQCYPGKYKNGRDKKPSVLAQHICKQYLEKTITNRNYTEIVCFGEVAYNMVDSIIKSNNINGIYYHKELHPSSKVSNSKLDSSY